VSHHFRSMLRHENFRGDSERNARCFSALTVGRPHAELGAVLAAIGGGTTGRRGMDIF
jgi:hypothetical protein